MMYCNEPCGRCGLQIRASVTPDCKSGMTAVTVKLIILICVICGEFHEACQRDDGHPFVRPHNQVGTDDVTLAQVGIRRAAPCRSGESVVASCA